MHNYEQRGGLVSFQDSLASSHRTFADRHVGQREAHQRVKKLHEKANAQVTALKQAIEESL